MVAAYCQKPPSQWRASVLTSWAFAFWAGRVAATRPVSGDHGLFLSGKKPA